MGFLNVVYRSCHMKKHMMPDLILVSWYFLPIGSAHLLIAQGVYNAKVFPIASLLQSVTRTQRPAYLERGIPYNYNRHHQSMRHTKSSAALASNAFTTISRIIIIIIIISFVLSHCSSSNYIQGSSFRSLDRTEAPGRWGTPLQGCPPLL